MAIFERSLSKLTLEAFQDRERHVSLGSMTAMYNPTKIQLSYRAEYVAQDYLDYHRQNNRYQHLRPGDLNLELILDAQLPGNRQSVDEQLSKLRALCFDIDGKTGEPHFLRIKWGRMSWHGHGYFAGRTSHLRVDYTLFDRNAAPQRALVHLTISADESLTQQTPAKSLNQAVLKAPALDSLPLMAAAAAAASAALAVGQVDYLSLAYNNDLNHLSAAQPGQELVIGSEKK